MKSPPGLWLVAALGLMVSAAWAQQQGAPPGGPGPRGPRVRPPEAVGVILEHHADLALADSQATAIAAVRARLDSLDQPLRARLDSLRSRAFSSSPGYDARWMAQRNQFRDIMSRLRQDDDAALQQVMALLSPQQRKTAKDLLDEERKKLEAGAPQRHRGGEFGRGRRGGD